MISAIFRVPVEAGEVPSPGKAAVGGPAAGGRLREERAAPGTLFARMEADPPLPETAEFPSAADEVGGGDIRFMGQLASGYLAPETGEGLP